MKITFFRCSPRHGVTDQLGDWFAAGLESAAISVNTIALRDYRINPCAGCNFCSKPPFSCILNEQDDTALLFAELIDSAMAVFLSPVYFYSLPAHFKAFIDRGQLYWNINKANSAQAPCFPPAIAILAAGRSKGELLFDGALRILKYFLMAGNAALKDKFVFRGLEDKNTLCARPEIASLLLAAGRELGARLIRHES